MWRIAGILAVLSWSTVAGAQSYGEGHDAFEAGDYAEAKEVWRPLAEDGDVRAQYGLGVLYEQGLEGVARRYEEAAQWYAEAARQGHSGAQNNLGLLYAQGRGVDLDPGRAVELWQLAAEAGHLVAQYNLGLAYYRGEGAANDDDTALRWFRGAAQGGLADGEYAMAQMYRLGVVVEEDLGKALGWYERAAAQGHEDAAAQAQALREEGVDPAPIEVAQAEPEEAFAPSGEDTAEAEVDAEMAEEPAAGPEPADEQEVAAVGPEAGEADGAKSGGPAQGAARVWLGSLGTREAAARHWSDVQARHSDILAGAEPSYAEVEVEDRGTFYRVLAGPYAGAAAAGEVCAAMQAVSADAFCEVVTDAE